MDYIILCLALSGIFFYVIWLAIIVTILSISQEKRSDTAWMRIKELITFNKKKKDKM